MDEGGERLGLEGREQTLHTGGLVGCSQGQVSQHPKPSSPQRQAPHPLSFLGSSPSPWPPEGPLSHPRDPPAFTGHERNSHRHLWDKAPKHSNTSSQAAASWLPCSHPREHRQPSVAQRVAHRGQDTPSHLQTSQTAPAGWTGQWLRSLGQGENTASHVSHRPPGTTGMHPGPNLPLHQPPQVTGEKRRQSLQQLCASCSKDRSPQLCSSRRDRFGHSQHRPFTGGNILAKRWEETASPQAWLCHHSPQKCQELVPLRGPLAAPQPCQLRTLSPVACSPPAHQSR